ncbi:MAG: flagellar protein FlgN, partial [Desulfovibrionaceae bacterium]
MSYSENTGTRPRLIQENLSRQLRAMLLLKVLLEEEFSLLVQRQTTQVSVLDLSIQELLRQVAAERHALRRLVADVQPRAQRVREVLALMPDDLARGADRLLDGMERAEQACSQQAQRNRTMVLGLHDQSRALLDY